MVGVLAAALPLRDALAQRLKIGKSKVARARRAYGIQPWRAGSFWFSTDPELQAKVVDVVGLYLAPPEDAVVLCVDEKSQVQALEHSAPVLPMQLHLIGSRSLDCIRHGTTTLFAALNVATEQATAWTQNRHRNRSWSFWYSWFSCGRSPALTRPGIFTW